MDQIFRFISAALIAAGGILMVYTGLAYNRIVKRVPALPGKLPTYATAFKHFSRIMICFFIFGYGVGLVDVVFRQNISPMFYFIGIVFFVAGLFFFILVKYLAYLVDALSDYNDNLQVEVESQMADILYQDELLRAANKTASIFLASSTDTFQHDLWESMGLLAQSVAVDRVYIWKNHRVDGELHCTQVYEWSEGAEPQQGNELTVDIAYKDNIPPWEEILGSNQSVKGLVRELSQEEQDQLAPQGIISILVVPIFIQGEFWGFVGFDDCHRERTFSKAEEGILRSASLLIATSLIRNEMTQALIDARDEADRNAMAKSDFLSNMSHEIRTPINAITGMSAIAKGTTDMERIQDCLTKIDVASKQLLGIINDILDMSKIEAGKMTLVQEPFNLHATIQNIKSIIGVRVREKDLNFTIDIPEDLPRVVVGDEMRLTQIFLNLLSNAVKFTPRGGSVTLRSVLVEDAGERWTLRFDIIDTGIGISTEQQKRLFKAFEQAERTTSQRYGGTGLGLAISRRIAGLMDGDVSVESELGMGSCFSAQVVLAKGDAAMLNPSSAGHNEGPIDLSGRRILLAEDIEINREIVTSLLEDKGAEVVCAVDGKEAVAMFTASPEAYDLILMDVYMPEMDGLTATEEIRKLEMAHGATVPILAMTANAFEEDVKKCLAAGMNGHIAKPIDIVKLYETLGEYLPGE